MEKPARIGRPSRVTPEDIVGAAYEIGLERATIRNVAERLRMSVPGLYHHVRTREDLLDLVVEFSFTRQLEDVPASGSFEDHLLFYGRKLFDFAIEHPAVITSIISGGIVTPKMAPHLEQLIARGVTSGLTSSEAFEIFTLVMAAVIGAVAVKAAARAMKREEGSFLLNVVRTLPKEGASAPQLRALISERGDREFDSFETVRAVLDGLRGRYGERLSRVG